ncbi:MAG: hypothetical protein ACLRFF_01325 [Alphaproteobacteria bacterium]
MKRAIKFKLKNGRVVTIRLLRADDYDAFVKFNKEFANGPSAKMNFEYPGAPVEPKENYVKVWSNKNYLYIAAFDGEKIVGYAQIRKLMTGVKWPRGGMPNAEYFKLEYDGEKFTVIDTPDWLSQVV